MAAIKLFRSTEMKNTLESDVRARRARTALASGNTARATSFILNVRVATVKKEYGKPISMIYLL